MSKNLEMEFQGLVRGPDDLLGLEEEQSYGRVGVWAEGFGC